MIKIFEEPAIFHISLYNLVVFSFHLLWLLFTFLGISLVHTFIVLAVYHLIWQIAFLFVFKNTLHDILGFLLWSKYYLVEFKFSFSYFLCDYFILLCLILRFTLDIWNVELWLYCVVQNMVNFCLKYTWAKKQTCLYFHVVFCTDVKSALLILYHFVSCGWTKFYFWTVDISNYILYFISVNYFYSCIL